MPNRAHAQLYKKTDASSLASALRHMRSQTHLRHTSTIRVGLLSGARTHQPDPYKLTLECSGAPS
eukprot:1892108-Pleurochrysis_carterae.AAC.1